MELVTEGEPSLRKVDCEGERQAEGEFDTVGECVSERTDLGEKEWAMNEWIIEGNGRIWRIKSGRMNSGMSGGVIDSGE
jgi:hypothetical protein